MQRPTKVTIQGKINVKKKKMDMVDRLESIVYSEKQIKIPSYIVLKKHLLLVISVISCMFTCLGWYLGTTNWLWKTWASWLVVIASLISTPLAVSASSKLNHVLLVIYSVVGGLEVIFKIVFITLVFNKKISVARECTANSIAPSSCINWRLDDLDLTNSMVFHTIASIAQVTLIIFSIQLTIFAFDRQKKRMLAEKMSMKGIIGPYQSTSEMANSSCDMFAGQPELNDYGTFQLQFLQRFKKKHNLTTTM